MKKSISTSNGGFFNASCTRLDGVGQILSGKRIFLTGGTGFFGKWLQLSFDYIVKKSGIKAELVVLSRDPEKFLRNNPGFRDLAGISYAAGDIRDFSFPQGGFDYIIHAATEASVKLAAENPQEMYSVIVDGTERMLKMGAEKAVKRLLYVSSGAVYGKQPPEISHMPEDFLDSEEFRVPDDPYGKGKYDAEKICLSTGLETVVARPYAFVGPFLPLDAHFAVGNFIRNCLNRQAIEIQGDGTPLRSYMYAADLVEWLWTIFAEGRDGIAYNIGSEQTISIYELAKAVAACFSRKTEIIVLQQPVTGPPLRYVPSVLRVRNEFGLEQYFDLSQALKKTINFYLGGQP